MINELVNNKSQLKLKLNVMLLALNVPGITPVIIPKFCIEANGSRSLLIRRLFGDIFCEIFGQGLMFSMVVTSLHGDFLPGGGCNILDTFLK